MCANLLSHLSRTSHLGTRLNVFLSVMNNKFNVFFFGSILGKRWEENLFLLSIFRLSVPQVRGNYPTIYGGP